MYLQDHRPAAAQGLYIQVVLQEIAHMGIQIDSLVFHTPIVPVFGLDTLRITIKIREYVKILLYSG